MEKKKTKRSPLMIPVKELAKVAHNIFMIKPEEKIILNKLKEIFSDGADVGYQRRINDAKLFNQKREARVKKSTDSLLDYIDDALHGGTKPKV